MKTQYLAIVAASMLLPLNAQTPAPAAPAAPAASPSTAESDQALLESYAANPTLENAARILSLTTLNPENATYREGFCSQLIRQHSAHLRELLEKVGMPGPPIRMLICTSCWLADTPESNAEAATTLKYDPIIAAYTRIKPQSQKPDFTKLENLSSSPVEAMALDMAWGAYDAARSRDILCSFIRCGTRKAAPENPYKLWFVSDEDRKEAERGDAMDVVSMAAKWSVLSRAKADAAFAAEVDACLASLPPEVQARWKEPLPDTPRNKSQYTPNPKG